MERGGDVLAEVIIFTLVGGATVLEFKSRKAKEVAKEAKKAQELKDVHDSLTSSIHLLQGTVIALNQSLDEMTERLCKLEQQGKH